MPRRAARWNWSDISLVFMILFILAFGLIILYSASYYDAAMNRESNYDPMFYLKKQGTWMMLGLAAMFLGSLIPYRFWWKVSYADGSRRKSTVQGDSDTTRFSFPKATTERSVNCRRK